MIWSDAAVKRLEQLRAEGLTWAEVARRLTREFGHPCSRGAAEGKANRMRKARGVTKHLRVDWWDQDRRTERLIEMWNATNGQAMTAGQIAKQLGTTRNAVLGKAHRLGEKGVHMVAKSNARNRVSRQSMESSLRVWAGPARLAAEERRKHKRRREQNAIDGGMAIRAANARQRAKEAATAPKRDELASMLSEPTESIPGVPFIDARNGHCRWPLWDGPDDPRHVCGAQRKTGSSYCSEHAERARNKYCPAPADAA